MTISPCQVICDITDVNKIQFYVQYAKVLVFDQEAFRNSVLN